MIINLTQHKATPEQIREGVININDLVNKTSDLIKEACGDYNDYLTIAPTEYLVKMLLTFKNLPTKLDIIDRANALAECVELLGVRKGTKVMIGGAPFLMTTLEQKLKEKGFIPVYAFSVRKSVDAEQPDGSVLKQNIFKHAGFIEA